MRLIDFIRRTFVLCFCQKSGALRTNLKLQTGGKHGIRK
nr:MAG TPA: hypothetical protein [Caudoviricetes sp.]DAO72734.1 MAG TPA: hypothetical protein [Caudoviricetes sp.]